MTCLENENEIVRLSDIIIPKLQSLVNDYDYTHYIITSGRAGTKSSFGGILEDYTIISEENGSVVVLRKFHNKLKKTVYKECLRAINRLKLDKNDFKITVSPMEVKYKDNGNTIYFTGNDSIDDTKGMIDENKPIKLVIVDEVTEFFDKGDGEDELQNVEATFIRGNDDNFRMMYFFNPPKNPKAPIMEWLNKMVKRPDTLHIHVTYLDVPEQWLGKKLIGSAEQLKGMDEKQYRWLWLGESVGIDELIYYMFNEEKHVKEFQKEIEENGKKRKIILNQLCISIDYGQMNATTFQAFAIDYTNKKLKGIDEYYYSGRDEGKQKSPSQYAQEFKKFKEMVEEETGIKVSFCFIDPSAKGLAEEIKRVCPEVRIINAQNDVALGISRVQKLLSYELMEISPKQKNLIGEMYLYEYDEDSIEKGKEVPVKTNDHCQDALRYLVMGVWKYLRVILPILKEGEKD